MLWIAQAAVAQRPAAGAAAPERRGAVTPLPAGHWAYDALDRLVAAGWIDPGRVDGARPLPVDAVAAALEAAAHATGLRAAQRRPAAGAAAQGVAGSGSVGAAPGGASVDDATARAMAEFARDALDRFRREFPEAAALTTYARVGYEARSDGGERWRGVVLGQAVAWAPWPSIGLGYAPELRYGAAEGAPAAIDWSHGRFGVAARWKALWLFAGRERLAFETGAGGGVTLSEDAAFDGLGFGLVEPVAVPGLGHARGLVYLSRFRGDAFGDPAGFAAIRLTLTPTPWMQLHLNRTIVFAREHRGAELTPQDMLRILVGKHTLFEDQRASIGLRMRARVGAWALQPYLEWGFEDTAGLDEDPGIVTGVFVPAVPGLAALSLRYEYAAFGEHARLFPGGEFLPRAWYHHVSGIRDRYVDGAGTPIGHPLGGYGYEHRIEAGAWADHARLRVQLGAFRRLRKQGNLLFESRPGASLGGSLDVHYAVADSLELLAAFRAEYGREGWSTSRAYVGVRW
ncbi:MAG TPA: capsule assembly Wzi family protein [Longimicrobiales bacterium]